MEEHASVRMCMQGWGVGVEREKEHYVCTQERERERERKKKEHTHVVRGWGRGQGERKSLRTWEREGEGEGEKEHMHAVVGGGGEKERAHVGERESERALGSSFCMFSPPGPALCKLGSARSAILPEVLTLVLRPFFDLPLLYFCGLFPSLSFSHLHFGLLFPILST